MALQVSRVDVWVGKIKDKAGGLAAKLAALADAGANLEFVIARRDDKKKGAGVVFLTPVKGAKQAVQMFGPAQRGVAMAVADCVEDGTIPADEADDVFVCVGVFIHWEAADDTKIQDYNYQATKESIKRAVAGEPKAKDVVAQKGSASHPFAAHD